jgi:hypothetical protein
MACSPFYLILKARLREKLPLSVSICGFIFIFFVLKFRLNVVDLSYIMVLGLMSEVVIMM